VNLKTEAKFSLFNQTEAVSDIQHFCKPKWLCHPKDSNLWDTAIFWIHACYVIM